MIQNKKLLINAFLATVLVLLAERGQANPDVWVRASMTFHFADEHITSLSYRWAFDEYYSSRNIGIFDANQNGRFEADETDLLRRETFDRLKKYGYYLHLWQGESEYPISDPTSFAASIDNTSLVFEFQVLLNPPVDPRQAPVIVSMNDREYVVDYKFVKQKFLLVDGIMPDDCKFRLKRGKGAQAGHPQLVTLSCGE